MQRIMKHFIQMESKSGVLLILAAAFAMLCANSTAAPLYRAFLDTVFSIGIQNTDGNFVGLSKPLFLWINDALMVLFFFLVGLEIKREIVSGELSSRDKLLQPVFAAIGGMIVPALLFLVVVQNDPFLYRGWAIVSATDIAFALTILSFFGSRIPIHYKILLTAIAILDDLGAIIIIALFYSGGINIEMLGISVVGLVGLWLLKCNNSQKISLYALAGFFVWLGFLKGGLHPTLAGVITALFIPMRGVRGGEEGLLYKTEHAIHPMVGYFILPLFGFANAGLVFEGLSFDDLFQTLPLAILIGLVIGKPMGVMGGLLLGHISKIAPLHKDQKLSGLFALSLLCGIGFTMSLFIGDLAFTDAAQHNLLRLGVITASVLASFIGAFVCYTTFIHSSSKDK